MAKTRRSVTLSPEAQAWAEGPAGNVSAYLDRLARDAEARWHAALATLAPEKGGRARWCSPRSTRSPPPATALAGANVPELRSVATRETRPLRAVGRRHALAA